MKLDGNDSNHTLPEQSQQGALKGTCSSFSFEIISKACLLWADGNTSFAKLSYSLVKWRHTAGGLLPFDNISGYNNKHINILSDCV